MTYPLRIRYQTIEFDNIDIHLCTLRDKQQFSDQRDEAHDFGISSASWPLFGVIWPSSLVLANYILDYKTEGKKILELGCGIALTSLLPPLRPKVPPNRRTTMGLERFHPPFRKKPMTRNHHLRVPARDAQRKASTHHAHSRTTPARTPPRACIGSPSGYMPKSPRRRRSGIFRSFRPIAAAANS